MGTSRFGPILEYWADLRGALGRKALGSQLRGIVVSSVARKPFRSALLAWLALIFCVGALWLTLFDVRNNLALGKPVTMSSVCKRRPEYSWRGMPPSGLVDGGKWRYYDICTEKSRDPWVMVDLKAPVRIDRVVVTGRRDCCWATSDLPLVLELSNDGASFLEVARRVLPFSDLDPWRSRLPHIEGRYLRLRVAASHPAEIVLTELEVFGAPGGP